MTDLLKSGAILFFALALTACVGTAYKADDGKHLPDWVLNTPLEQGFLYGVGSADIIAGDVAAASKRAKDMARLELLKQIEVKVSGEVDQSITETTGNTGTELSQQLHQEVRNQVPAFRLSGVRSVDSYRDKAGKHITVLLRFDVSKERAALKQQLAELDARLEDYNKTLDDSTAQGMDLLRQSAPALVVAEQRSGLQARYNRLAANGHAAPLLNAASRVMVQRIYQHIANLKVSVQAEGPAEPLFHTRLLAALNKKGIQVTGHGPGDIRLRYQLQGNSTPQHGVYFAITTGQLWVEDATGHVVHALHARAKGVSVDPQQARARSLTKIANQLTAALLAALFHSP